MNSGVPKLQYCTRVSITNDKWAREWHELAQYLRKFSIKQWPNGDENRTQPGKHNPQQNKSCYTAGEKAGMMRLICKIKENNRRGISNHDRGHVAHMLWLCSPCVTMTVTRMHSLHPHHNWPTSTHTKDMAGHSTTQMRSKWHHTHEKPQTPGTHTQAKNSKNSKTERMWMHKPHIRWIHVRDQTQKLMMRNPSQDRLPTLGLYLPLPIQESTQRNLSLTQKTLTQPTHLDDWP